MRTSSGQKMQRPGQGYGFVRTVTGVTPLCVRTGRSRRASTNPSASTCQSFWGAKCRKPAMISLREKRPRPRLGWRLRIRSSPRESRFGAPAISSTMATSSRSWGAGSNAGSDRRGEVWGTGSSRWGVGYCIAGFEGNETLDAKTVRTLNGINRHFYRAHAEAFSATRQRPWPGWCRVLDLAEAHAGGRPLDVLDVGCGNGRFAAFLADRGMRYRYLGIDASRELLALAQAHSHGVGSADEPVRYHQADFLEEPIGDGSGHRFSLVVLFGVLHHVPGREQRLSLLRSLARCLQARGLLVVTAWQLERRRFREKQRPWKEFNDTARNPIDLSQLEPGDHLLPWGHGDGVRFCHFADDAEIDALSREARLARIAAFSADGPSGDLNRYFVFAPRS